MISFIDDNFELSKYFLKRDYTELAENLKNGDWDFDYEDRTGKFFIAYKITRNNPLTDLYHAPFYVVRFYLADVSTLHDEEQEKHMEVLLEHLKENMNTTGGYYNLRIPTHIVDMIRAYNKVMARGIFCGGTVEEIISGKKTDCKLTDGLNVFIVNEDYIEKNKQLLWDMTYDSFRAYQGQYHISPVTEKKAGKIYENWVSHGLENVDGQHVFCAEYNGIPIGFVTVMEKETAVEGVLSAVDEKYRQYGAYRAMISEIINYAYDRGKCFITSTQFDNFIVQGVWNSMGLKPFYSIYNFHIDNTETTGK